MYGGIECFSGRQQAKGAYFSSRTSGSVRLKYVTEATQTYRGALYAATQKNESATDLSHIGELAMIRGKMMSKVWNFTDMIFCSLEMFP